MAASFLILAATLTLLPAAAPQAGPGEPVRDPSALAKKADAVRATAGELKYMKLPWVTDLFEGFRLAKEEKRPVFLYMITGDPLDDC